MFLVKRRDMASLMVCRRTKTVTARSRVSQQASLTWAAGGLRVAERNGAGMERKVLSAAKP